MPVLDFAPPAPPAVHSSPVKPVARLQSTNFSRNALSSPLSSPAGKDATFKRSSHLGGEARAPGEAQEDDVSTEMALSQETDRRLSLRGRAAERCPDETGREPLTEVRLNGNGVEETAVHPLADEDAQSRNDQDDESVDERAPLHGESLSLPLRNERCSADASVLSQSRSGCSRRRQCGTTSSGT